MAPAANKVHAPHAPEAQTVFVVDDDPLVRQSIEVLLAELNVRSFAGAESFLQHAGARCGDCLIADVQMPQMSGIDLQHRLTEQGVQMPVIVLTGHADVDLAVEAMKAGAFDFIQKPFEATVFKSCVLRALEGARHLREQSARRHRAQCLLECLTERERDVFVYLTGGYANKVVAHLLGISPRTVEVHRARIQEKLDATCLADLVRIAQDAELKNPNSGQPAQI